MKHHTLACRQFNTPCPKVAVADKTRCFSAFAQVMQCVWPLFVSPLEQRMQPHRRRLQHSLFTFIQCQTVVVADAK